MYHGWASLKLRRASWHHGFDVGWSNEQVRLSQDHPKTAELAYCDAEISTFPVYFNSIIED